MKAKLIVSFFLSFILITSFKKDSLSPTTTSYFTVPSVSVLGSDIIALSDHHYTNIIAQIEFDATDGSFTAYATQAAAASPIEVTPIFNIESTKSLPYPCVFGNMNWTINITGIDATKTYLLEPIEVKIADHKYLVYRWTATAMTPSSLQGSFNPVPPKISGFNKDLFDR
jgi:hypothetical protein